jgi:hypothetical protein
MRARDDWPPQCEKKLEQMRHFIWTNRLAEHFADGVCEN